MAYVCSSIASGNVVGLPDYSEALSMDGVVGAVDWRDIPGSLKFGHLCDVPVFVKDQVGVFKKIKLFFGQLYFILYNFINIIVSIYNI